MTSGEKDRKGGPSGVRKGGDAARAERLKAALRENLRRRKVQARQRSAGGKDHDKAHDSAGFIPDKPED